VLRLSDREKAPGYGYFGTVTNVIGATIIDFGVKSASQKKKEKISTKIVVFGSDSVIIRLSHLAFFGNPFRRQGETGQAGAPE
jgi:hypothetical protein